MNMLEEVNKLFLIKMSKYERQGINPSVNLCAELFTEACNEICIQDYFIKSYLQRSERSENNNKREVPQLERVH